MYDAKRGITVIETTKRVTGDPAHGFVHQTSAHRLRGLERAGLPGARHLDAVCIDDAYAPLGARRVASHGVDTLLLASAKA